MAEAASDQVLCRTLSPLPGLVSPAITLYSSCMYLPMKLYNYVLLHLCMLLLNCTQNRSLSGSGKYLLNTAQPHPAFERAAVPSPA